MVVINNLSDIQPSGHYAVIVGSAQCGPCMNLKRQADNYNNCYYIDVANCIDLAASLGIRSLPTTVFFKDSKIDNVCTGTSSEVVQQLSLL